MSSKKLKSCASKVSSSQFQSAFIRFGVSPSHFGEIPLVLLPPPAAPPLPPLLEEASASAARATSPGGGAGRGASFARATPVAVPAVSKNPPALVPFGVEVGVDDEEGDDDGVAAASVEI